MMKTRFLELQEIMANSEEEITDRLMWVEDELGAALADLGTGEGIPGGSVCECLEWRWIHLEKKSGSGYNCGQDCPPGDT
jgi:hypothetical protein